MLVSLDELDLSEKEKKHLAELIDSNLHHTILDAVLSELPDEEKAAFLQHLSAARHDKIWEILNQKVDKIEDKIKQTADEFLQDIRTDIKDARQHPARGKNTCT